MNQTLEITKRKKTDENGDKHIVKLNGRFDHTTAPQFEQYIKSLLSNIVMADLGPEEKIILIIDLNDVNYLNGEAIRKLIAIEKNPLLAMTLLMQANTRPHESLDLMGLAHQVDSGNAENPTEWTLLEKQLVAE